MWFKQDIKKNLVPVVILCAGRGRRLLELGEDLPKAMVKINNQPVIKYIIDYWKSFAKKFIFVLGYKKEQIISFVNRIDLDCPFDFVLQDKPLGIAHAISCVEKYIDNNFIVVLGDCICQGDFIFPDSFEQGIGVWQTQDTNHIKQSYSVEIENNLVCKVVEKPKEVKNNLCGMGYYFFQKKVFNYIRQTPPSNLRNEIEITDVIQKMIDHGQRISPLYFKGTYINITSPPDILLAQEILNL